MCAWVCALCMGVYVCICECLDRWMDGRVGTGMVCMYDVYVGGEG